jgi:hypothetical protein
MRVCYWCKKEPCSCRNIWDDYPKYMIKNTRSEDVCKFCKRTDCVCATKKKESQMTGKEVF